VHRSSGISTTSATPYVRQLPFTLCRPLGLQPHCRLHCCILGKLGYPLIKHGPDVLGYRQATFDEGSCFEHLDGVIGKTNIDLALRHVNMRPIALLCDSAL
jgi:hypothetical protein